MADGQQIGEDVYQSTINILESFYKELRSKRSNPHHLYYSCFEGELTRIDTPLYNWQWIIEDHEYKEIKNILSENKEILKDLISVSPICCKLLHLYVSEWFKREYNGHDRQGNAFDSIGLSNEAKRVCENQGLSIKVYRSDETEGQNEWLYSLYVDGGLPLNYLLNRENNKFRNTIESLIESADLKEGKSDLLDELDTLCGNGVLNQSFRNDESISQYIKVAIIERRIDQDRLQTIIEDSKNHIYEKSKFEVRFYVFKSAVCTQIMPYLYLRSEPYEYNHIGIITETRLSKWNINTDMESFVVSIKNGNQTIWEKKFFKNVRGHFVTTPQKNLYKLAVGTQLCTNKWTVNINGNRINRNSIYNRLADDGYLHMYSHDGINWSTEPTNSYQKSALLYDKSQNIAFNNKNTIENDLDESLGWIPFEDHISFTIGNQNIVLYDKAGKIVLDPINKGHSLSKYVIDTENYYLIESGRWPVFNIGLTKPDHGDIVPQWKKEHDIKWSIRRSTQDQFRPVSEDGARPHIAPGFSQLKATILTSRQEKTINCFALPPKATISNSLESSRTDFKCFEGVMITEGDNTLNDENGTFRRRWQYEQHNYNHFDPFAKYNLISNGEKLTLYYPKPVSCTIIKNIHNGSVIAVAQQKDKEINIPIISIDNISAVVPDNPDAESITLFDKLYFAFSEIFNYKFNSFKKQNELKYVKFKTFTHQFRWNNRQLLLDGSDNQLNDAKFVFAPINSPSEIRDLKLEFNRQNQSRTIIKIDNFNDDEDGIIIQVIDNSKPTLCMVKPTFIPNHDNYKEMNEDQRRTSRFNNISNYNALYDKHDFEKAIQFFELATITGNYFGCFDALLCLICKTKGDPHKEVISLCLNENAPSILVQFLKAYKQYKESKEESINYKALWRLANEFLFDWFLIPISDWNENGFSEDHDFIITLLQHKPFGARLNHYNEIIKRYDDIKFPSKIQDNQRELNIVLRTVFKTYQTRKGQYSQEKTNFWHQEFSCRKSIMEYINQSKFWIFVFEKMLS